MAFEQFAFYRLSVAAPLLSKRVSQQPFEPPLCVDMNIFLTISNFPRINVVDVISGCVKCQLAREPRFSFYIAIHLLFVPVFVATFWAPRLDSGKVAERPG